MFLSRILEVPGSNVGQSQDVLRFFVGFLFTFRHILGYWILPTLYDGFIPHSLLKPFVYSLIILHLILYVLSYRWNR